jgi:hypothetical protein
MQNQSSNCCTRLTQTLAGSISSLITMIAHPIETYNHWGMFPCAQNLQLAGSLTDPTQTVLSSKVTDQWCYNVLPLYLSSSNVQSVLGTLSTDPNSVPIANAFVILNSTQKANLLKYIVNNNLSLRWDLFTNQPYAEINHRYDVTVPSTPCTNGTKDILDTQWIIENQNGRFLAKYVTFVHTICV